MSVSQTLLPDSGPPAGSFPWGWGGAGGGGSDYLRHLRLPVASPAHRPWRYFPLCKPRQAVRCSEALAPGATQPLGPPPPLHPPTSVSTRELLNFHPARKHTDKRLGFWKCTDAKCEVMIQSLDGGVCFAVVFKHAQNSCFRHKLRKRRWQSTRQPPIVGFWPVGRRGVTLAQLFHWLLQWIRVKAPHCRQWKCDTRGRSSIFLSF